MSTEMTTLYNMVTSEPSQNQLWPPPLPNPLQAEYTTNHLLSSRLTRLNICIHPKRVLREGLAKCQNRRGSTRGSHFSKIHNSGARTK